MSRPRASDPDSDTLTLHQALRPRLRRFIDTFGEVYAKAVIAATAAALVALPLLFGVPLLSSGGTPGAVYRAMGLLTTASPCALVLVPLAYVSAISAITSRCGFESRFRQLGLFLAGLLFLSEFRFGFADSDLEGKTLQAKWYF